MLKSILSPTSNSASAACAEPQKHDLERREIALLRENLAVARRERDEFSRGLAAEQNRSAALERALERANDAAWHARWDARCWLTGFVLVNLFAAAYAAMVFLSR